MHRGGARGGGGAGIKITGRGRLMGGVTGWWGGASTPILTCTNVYPYNFFVDACGDSILFYSVILYFARAW